MNLIPASMDGCGELVQKLVCLNRGGHKDGGESDSPEPWMVEAPWYQALAPLQSPSSPPPPEYLSLMKRRSRDMETETEEELLLLVYPTSAMDFHHGVEEYVSDVPFAGLFKGSTSMETRAERPKTLRKLRNVYEHANMIVTGPASSGGEDTANEEAKCTSDASSKSAGGVLSPFDEQEEWAKISEIMASFGTGLVRESVFVSELEKEFQARLGLLNLGETSNVDPLASPVGKWLASINLPQYEQTFINFGYDHLDFLNGVLNEADLKEMCVSSEEDRTKILDSLKDLPCKIKDVRVLPINNNNNNNTNNNNNNEPKEGGDEPASVDEWLEMLQLSCYADTFKKHLYTEMERVRNIWEVELTAVLEINKPGHRHRMMASLPDNGSQPTIQDINQELSHLKSSMQELETKVVPQPSGTGTLRHSHKKNRPAPPPPPPPGGPAAPDLEIRDPSSLLVGVPPTLTATWRHRPHALLSGHLTYHARYLGSTVVHEMQGNESTKKSIQRLKKPQSEQNSPRDIYLAISYRGVKFLSGDTRELVCEHEIRNIHCACQDADDLTYFAYITKDHTSKSHYCHVFSVQNLDQATEIILTLGQAFEVAYQMALRETSSKGNGHTRSHSANLAPITSQPNHNRSHSVNEIKLNGHTTVASPTLVAEDV